MLDAPQRAPLKRISAADLGPSDAGEIAFFMGVLRKRRRLIGGITALGAILGVLVLFTATPTYKARSVVLIDFKRLAALDEDFSTSSGRIDSSAVLSQIEILKSESVVNRMVIDEKLDEDPEFVGKLPLPLRLLGVVGILPNPMDAPQAERRRLAAEAVVKSMAVDRIDLSYAISIDFVARTAEKAARLANSVAAMYIQDQLEAKRDASEKASSWFSGRIAELQADVDAADRKAVEYRLRNGIMSSDGKFIDEQQLADVSQKLLQARLTRFSAEAKIAQIGQIIATGAVQGALVDELSNEVIVPLRNAYLEAKRQAAEISLRYGAKHESVTRIRQSMVEIENSIADEFKRIQQGAKSDVEIAKSREQTLQNELNELARLSAAAQGARVELSQLESTASAVKSIRDTFMQRYVEGIQKQGFPITEARVITKAPTPVNPSFPTPSKAIGGATLLSFGFAFCLAIALEAFSRRIRTRRQAEEATLAPCMGFLPIIGQQPQLATPAGAEDDRHRTRRNARLQFATRAPFSLYAETLRALKVSVDIQRPGESVVIGVTSCASDDGGTTVAGNLAELCARGGEPTLLIDGNMRRPSLSNLLAPHATAGLQEVLRSERQLADALFRAENPALTFIPAVGYGQNAAEAGGRVIELTAFGRLVSVLREHYRYIIIDLPPIGAVADARLLSDLIDSFVLVLKWDRTEAHVVRECLRANREVAQKLIGTVLNHADMQGLVQSREAYAVQSAYLSHPS